MKRLTTGLALGLCTAAAAAATPSMEEMWALIQQQQEEIAQLKQQLATAEGDIRQTSQKVEATADLVEGGGMHGQSLASSWTERTQLGGYAEMHYNNLDNEHSGGDDKDELDFHRFVVYMNHQFSDRTRLYSEVELEHSLVEGNEDKGEVELEQAYIEHDLTNRLRLKSGLFLVPVGILNLTHEPDTFYGVERNPVESNIIPTTWWEGGLGLAGEIVPGLNFETDLTSGLKLEADEGQWKIRDGRQKVSRADASDPAYTAHLKYSGIAGLQLGLTVQYQQDLYQGDYSADVDAMLYEADLTYSNGPFGLRALAATWDIDNAINQIQPGADQQEGWYIEPSWLLQRNLGIFGRYSEWDNQAGGAGDTEYGQWNVGLNYWLEEHVVFKVDYQWQDAPDGQNELDGLNLGVGWSY